MGEMLLFYIFAALTVGMVLLMILQMNPVTSALCLVFSFFGLSGLYVLLQAPFVAILQILVYAGAIMVLFIFVVMLLNLKREELLYDRINTGRVVSLAVAVFILVWLGLKLIKIPAAPFMDLPQGFGEATAVGRLLFTEYFLPFELVSVLLLTAIVGAVILGRRGS